MDSSGRNRQTTAENRIGTNLWDSNLCVAGGHLYISEIYAAGFRCFSAEQPLQLHLKTGLNILVGPNDAGKTALADIPRFLLWTRGDDFVRLEHADFHIGSNGVRATELLLRCTLEGLTPDEESSFLEWCTNEDGALKLHICLRAILRESPGGGHSVATQYRAGMDADGLPLDGDLREYLRITYLRPLRDAERELRAGRRSRLSKILGALPNFNTQSQATVPGEPKTISDIMSEAEKDIEDNKGVKDVQSDINENYLGKLSFAGEALSATLSLGTRQSFDQVLERLELYLNPRGTHTERMTRGLGYNNLLFMAAELLLLQSHPDQLPFLLIEEPEAHLHPQHQALFMQVLQEKSAHLRGETSGQQIQVLLTTHSPQLAANANLEALVMIVGHKIFDLTKGKTKLEADDYLFLRRFLDATKANLFFARGVIIVEGDGEALLLPALARKLGKPLGKHGVSIVNVGHRGLFRYSRIFQRSDNTRMPINVALIPDRDIPPDGAKTLVAPRPTESDWNLSIKAEYLAHLKEDSGGSVEAFVSEQWTLEFDLASKAEFAAWMHQAVQLAKGRANKTREEIIAEANDEIAGWIRTKNIEEIAVEIYTPLFKRQVSKAQTAEQLARILDELPIDTDFASKMPSYLVSAINFVTETNGAPEPAKPDDALTT